jgi:hypothetical protein
VTGIGEQYQCEICGGWFTKTVSDEDAQAEQSALWQPQPGEENGIACDDCFRRVLAWAQAEHPEYLR